MTRLTAGFQLFHSSFRNCNFWKMGALLPIMSFHHSLTVSPKRREESRQLKELSALRDELEEAVKGCYDHSRAARLNPCSSLVDYFGDPIRAMIFQTYIHACMHAYIHIYIYTYYYMTLIYIIFFCVSQQSQGIMSFINHRPWARNPTCSPGKTKRLGDLSHDDLGWNHALDHGDQARRQEDFVWCNTWPYLKSVR